MDELTQHRKRRLAALIEGKPYNGSQQAFANAAKISKGRVSQLLDPDESFGERAARNLALELRMGDERYFETGFLTAHAATRSSASASLTVAEDQAPSTVTPVPTVGAMVLQLGRLLETLNEMQRASIAPLIAKVLQDPARAQEAAATADAIASSHPAEPFPQPGTSGAARLKKEKRVGTSKLGVESDRKKGT